MKRERWPTFLTSGNLMCGVLSMMLVYHGHLTAAAWLIVVAILFDFLDGKIARMLGVSGDFGKEFDSLADIVSFGAAPALLMYAYALHSYGLFGAMVGVIYVLCGALRLARFNLSKPMPYFLGLPITAAGGFIVSLFISKVFLPLPIMVAIIFGVSYLMVSKVKYGNLKKLSKRNQLNRKVFLLLFFIFCGITIASPRMAPLITMTVYVLSGPLGLDWGEIIIVKSSEEGEENESKEA